MNTDKNNINKNKTKETLKKELILVKAEFIKIDKIAEKNNKFKDWFFFKKISKTDKYHMSMIRKENTIKIRQD